jgi:hypothetical protein
MERAAAFEQMELNFEEQELTYERFLELVRMGTTETEERKLGNLTTYPMVDEQTKRIVIGRWVKGDKGLRRNLLDPAEQEIVETFWNRYNKAEEQTDPDDQVLYVEKDGTKVYRPSSDHKYQGPFKS